MGTWQRNVHRFIALTPFAREKFVAGGLPRSRISVKPNFVSALPPQRGRAPRGALYVGRLSMEKGVRVLLNAWRELPEIPLTIIGDGPERSALQASAPPNVTFRGALPGAVVREQMEAAACLIVPSIWYEGFPMTVVEAFAAGLPVIASRIGSLTDIVEDGKTGRLFAAGDPLALTQVVREYFSQGQHVKLSAAARMEYESRFTPQINLAELTAIYDGAIAEACEFVVSSERR